MAHEGGAFYGLCSVAGRAPPTVARFTQKSSHVFCGLWSPQAPVLPELAACLALQQKLRCMLVRR